MAPIVVIFYLPFFRRPEISTAYEYLERRFGLSIRLFGSASFMAFQVARMAIVVFLPSLALSTVTGVDVYLCIATIGVMATLYTVLGGMEAVVWTDVLQVFVLIGGLFVALALAVDGAGGLGPALEIARGAEKLRLFAPGTSWVDNASWYHVVEGSRYRNDNGVGPNLRFTTGLVRDMVADSIRYWSEHIGVDGFRFDLASSLARQFHEVDRLSAFFDGVLNRRGTMAPVARAVG